MKIEEVITVHPKTHEQLNALKAFMQAFKIKFEVVKESSYNPEFVDKILESQKQVDEGNFTEVKLKDLKSFMDNL